MILFIIQYVIFISWTNLNKTYKIENCISKFYMFYESSLFSMLKKLNEKDESK
jgi:hypothetical protein